jgi:hypothetical protein
MNYNKKEKMQYLIVPFKLMGLVFVSCLPEKRGPVQAQTRQCSHLKISIELKSTIFSSFVQSTQEEKPYSQ